MSSRTLSASLLVVVLTLSGCVSFETQRLRNRIADDLPEGTVRSGMAMSFGWMSVATARTVLALSGDDDTESARALMRHVKSVKFGRWGVDEAVAFDRAAQPRVFDHYESKGWMRVLTVREDGEVVWILAREKQETLRDLLMVVLSEEDLVITKVSGNLSRGLAEAMHSSDWMRRLPKTVTALVPAADSIVADSTSAVPIDA